MISDTLSEAIEDIARYRRELPQVYGSIALALDALVALDPPPKPDRARRTGVSPCARASRRVIR